MEIFETLKNDELKTLYNKSRELYYLDGSSTLTDVEFDFLEELLKNKQLITPEIGYISQSKINVKHETAMLSLKKIKAVDGNGAPFVDFSKWLPKRESVLEFTPKFDGCSANVMYNNGKLKIVATRGDGNKGQDITNKIKHCIPNELLNVSSEVRGEVVMNINTFNKKYKKYKNVRNFVAGLLNKDDVTPAHLDLEFIAFEHKCLDNTLNLLDLQKNGFVIPTFKIIDDFKKLKTSFIEIFNYFHNYKINQSPYQLDGIVVKIMDLKLREVLGYTSHHPNWAVAIKFSPMQVITTINDIIWKLGKTGEFNPVAQLEPVEFEGSVISKCSLHNWNFITKKQAYPGSKVSIAKMGDIIPGIVEVLTPGDNEYKYPKICPHCKTELKNDGTHITCENKNCPQLKIIEFVKSLEILNLDFLGEKTISKIYNTGLFETVYNLFDKSKFNENMLIKFGDFKRGKSLTKIINSVNSVKSLDIDVVIMLLGINNLGKSISKQLGNLFSKIDYTFVGLDKSIINKFNDQEIGHTKLKNAIDILEKNNITIKYFEKIKDDNFKYFEMTGNVPDDVEYKTKKDYTNYIENNSLFRHGKLNNECTYLITNNKESKTGKMSKAIKLGVEILSYDDFLSLINK